MVMGGKSSPEYFRDYRVRLRDKCYAALGNACACCGEDESKFLQIDHIHGGGNDERRTYKCDNIFIMRKNNYDPTVYQLLCANCHNAKTRYGTCPHKTQEEVAI